MTDTDAGSAAAGNLDQSTAAANGGGELAGAAQAPANVDAFSTLDADMRTYAENKGWHKDHNPVGAVLKSYRELEGKLGNAVPVPAEDDAEGWEKFYTRAGRPEKAETYKLSLPEQHDQTMAGKIRSLFHQVGLSQSQATKMYDGYMDMANPLLQQQSEADKARAEAAEADALAARDEIGEARMAGAKMAFTRFVGNSPEDASALERVLGDGRMIRFFDKLAQTTGEDGKGGIGIGSASGNDDSPDDYSDIVSRAFKKAKAGNPAKE